MGNLNDRGGIGRVHRSSADLQAEARDQLASALKRAFPIPDSGAFADLLSALGKPAEQQH